jgi:hypothetical protein
MFKRVRHVGGGNAQDVPIEDFLFGLDDVLNPAVDEFEITVGYKDLNGQGLTLVRHRGLRETRTAISSILSFRGSRPVISQSIQTRGPA